MKKVFAIIIIVASCMDVVAQNVGIGTTTPGFPLNFANTIGDKISLYGNTGNHYGFGVQSGLLQIHTDLAVSNIAFGFGSSGSFNERMRILNNTDYDGMILNGRLILKNGSTDLVGGGPGVWLYKANNTGQLGFMGTQNNQNIGFYGGPAGWGFTYDAINSRVGIGNNNPNAPLAFPPSLGKKITLYPGATGDVGFAVAGNRLQIYADNPNADVAIGYDAAGTFNEKFAVKPNGALAINGNTGNAGQLLQSNGNGAAGTWVDNPVSAIYSQTEEIINTTQVTISSVGQQSAEVPGLTKTLVLSKASKVKVSYNVYALGAYCTICGVTAFFMFIKLNGVNTGNYFNSIGNGAFFDEMVSGMRIFTLAPGTYTIAVAGQNRSGPDLILGTGNPGPYPSFLFIEVIPQN